MRGRRVAGVLCLVFVLVAMSYFPASAEPTVRVRKDIPRDQEPSTAGTYTFDVYTRLGVQTEPVTETNVVDNWSTACSNIVVVSAPAGTSVDMNTRPGDFPCRTRWDIGTVAPGTNLVLHLQVTKAVPAGDSCLNRGLQANFIDALLNRSSSNGNNICFTDVTAS